MLDGREIVVSDEDGADNDADDDGDEWQRSVDWSETSLLDETDWIGLWRVSDHEGEADGISGIRVAYNEEQVDHSKSERYIQSHQKQDGL